MKDPESVKEAIARELECTPDEINHFTIIAEVMRGDTVGISGIGCDHSEALIGAVYNSINLLEGKRWENAPPPPNWN